jgi:hypothetical protein
MNRTKFIALTCGIALISAIAAFWIGLREGLRLGVMLDSAPRGAIALHHLRALDSGKTGNMRVGLEGDIDMALIWSFHIDQHPLNQLLEPVWGYPMHYRVEYLERLANYRKKTPSPLRAAALAKEPQQSGEEARSMREFILEGARDNDKIIEIMIQRHAPHAGNAQP